MSVCKLSDTTLAQYCIHGVLMRWLLRSLNRTLVFLGCIVNWGNELNLYVSTDYIRFKWEISFQHFPGQIQAFFVKI